MVKLDWRLRIVAKLVLSRLPLKYETWRRLNLFKHGSMEKPVYAAGVYRQHFERYVAAGGPASGYTAMELGPGDSIGTAIVAKAYGAKNSVLVDANAAAIMDAAPYRSLIDLLKDEATCDVSDTNTSSAAAILEDCNSRYLTDGFASLRTLPDSSADFIFSHAVLEHVRRSEFDAYLAEMRRVIRPNGAMSHRIDLKDHLGGGLNNLRFSTRVWESPLFARSGFYTNRIRASELLGKLRLAGFECRVVKQDRWEDLPIKRSQLAAEFSDLSDDDLLISGIDVVCRPR